MELENPCEGCQYAPIYTNITVCKYCDNVDKRFSKMDLHKAKLEAYREFGEWVIEWLRERIQGLPAGTVNSDKFLEVIEELKKSLAELWKEDGHVTE